MEDHERDVLRLLDQLIDTDEEPARWSVCRALDITALPIIVSHVNDAVVLVNDLVAFYYGGQILRARAGRSDESVMAADCCIALLAADKLPKQVFYVIIALFLWLNEYLVVVL